MSTNFFDRVKKSIGLSSSTSMNAGKGHRLGGGEGDMKSQSPRQQSAAIAENNKLSIKNSPSLTTTFDAVFTSEDTKIGIEILPVVLQSGSNSVPMVSIVQANSPADHAGIQVNDVITALDGNRIDSYDVFYDIFASYGRPLTLRYPITIHFNFKILYRIFLLLTFPFSPRNSESFTRGLINDTSEKKGSPRSTMSSTISSVTKSFQTSIKSSSSSKTEKPSHQQQSALTEDQKEERRKAMILAAQSRSKEWDNKFGKGSGKRHAASIAAASAG